MELLTPKPPISVGILLTYLCTGECRHCMYACSPRMPNDWVDEAGLRSVLEQLAPSVIPHSPQGRVGINEGIHLTGVSPSSTTRYC